jgi:myo-inositol-1-phosphate synthase
MSNERVGFWIVGARGGVAVTTITGLVALQRNLLGDEGLASLGLLTTAPEMAHLRLPDWENLVVGGHEIRPTTLRHELVELHQNSRVIDARIVEGCGDALAEIDARIRPGTLWNVGDRIAALAGEIPATPQHNARAGAQAVSARGEVERLKADLQDFRAQHALQWVVVVNLASTEALLRDVSWPATWAATQALLDDPACPLPASTLYAIAALDTGCAYVNFTPSLGSLPAGIDELARLRGTCHAGRDGKTGETLLKSVLAPMFLARRLEVMSWVGHNIFGNLDGKVLDDPRNKSAKLQSKDSLLGEILGYAPQSHISIEHIASLGDWKTAWDHVHFRGFLGTPMTMQLTWQGCDSILAAPLVLDLVRLTTAARQRGVTGTLGFLSSYFKSPMGTSTHSFADQFRELWSWVETQRA